MSYHERLNIPTTNINEAKTLIKDEIRNTILLKQKYSIKLDKQTYRLVGPAGIGKTAICSQICRELTEELKLNENEGQEFDMIKIQAPVLSRDDFLVPFPIKDENGEVSKFRMLYSDFVPIDESSYGLFVIDELSRGDHNLQQLMWQVENENAIHIQDLPENWFVISLDNPDEQEYSLDTLEDAAGLRRKAQVYVHHSPKEFLNWARDNNIFPELLEYFNQYPSRTYDEESQKQGMVYTNPASIERFSNVCWKYYYIGGGIRENSDKLYRIAESLFNRSSAQPLMEFIIDKTKNIHPEDIVHDRNKVENDLEKMIENNEAGKLAELTTGVVTYLANTKPDLLDRDKANIAKFLSEIPTDTAAIFVNEIDNFEKDSEEFAFITRLHMELYKDYDDYREGFYNKMFALYNE